MELYCRDYIGNTMYRLCCDYNVNINQSNGNINDYGYILDRTK